MVGTPELAGLVVLLALAEPTAMVESAVSGAPAESAETAGMEPPVAMVAPGAMGARAVQAGPQEVVRARRGDSAARVEAATVALVATADRDTKAKTRTNPARCPVSTRLPPHVRPSRHAPVEMVGGEERAEPADMVATPVPV